MLEVDIENRAFPNSPIVSRDFRSISFTSGGTPIHIPQSHKKSEEK